MEATIRLARLDDIEQLVEMRRDFTFEDFDPSEVTSRPGYEHDCSGFLINAITSGRWKIWVAEVGGHIVSHAYVALIDKVPRLSVKTRASPTSRMSTPVPSFVDKV